jgi:hypothetical protein
MGLYDSIYIEASIIEKLNTFFTDDVLPFDHDWQTKCLYNDMSGYFLKTAESGIKLFYIIPLDPKDDYCKKWWHEYTDQEIEEINKNGKGKFLFLEKEKGDGYFHEDAFKPDNRKLKDMGELPHQFVTIYTSAPTDLGTREKWFELDIKFTNGYVDFFKRRWHKENWEVEKVSEWIKIV